MLTLGKASAQAGLLLISDWRLNVPTITTSTTGASGSRDLHQSIYVKEQFNGGSSYDVTFLGHWVVDGVSEAQLPNKTITMQGTFPASTWYKVYDLSKALSPGIHTVKFVIDQCSSGNQVNNNLATYVEDISITGFVPSRDGWRETNSLACQQYGVKFDGICEGMSQSARSRFRGLIVAPSTLTLIQKCNIWGRLHLAGSTNFNSVGLRRVRVSITDNYSPQDYKNTLYSEADRIKNMHLDMNDPCVIDCPSFINSTAQPPGTAHSVVGVAAFFSDSIYDDQTQSENKKMRRFSIYDPNRPSRDDAYINVFEAHTQNAIPTFQFTLSGADNSDKKMWVENSNVGR